MLAATALSTVQIADMAVAAIRAEADLTPKPGLVDQRGSGAHSDMDLAMLHASADALHSAFVECASAATAFGSESDLRTQLGVIGRAGERKMLAATGGVNTHRGALWAVGLLSAGAARTGPLGAVDVAARLAAIPDPDVAAATSHGAQARRRYGVSGAAGEAQAGFPHARLHALPALRAARHAGADEGTARLTALLTLMATVDDTCVLHRGGSGGLRALQSGAKAVLDAGGIGTVRGRRRFAALDELCLTRRLSPGGSGDLLSTTLFLDALDERIPDMQTLTYRFPAREAATHPIHVGVVASGDLEILLEPLAPGDDDGVVVRVRTSVNGFDTVWHDVLERFFTRTPLAGRWELNDFGATPGVVNLRLRQASEAAAS